MEFASADRALYGECRLERSGPETYQSEGFAAA
jgi:hypothetical protein